MQVLQQSAANLRAEIDNLKKVIETANSELKEKDERLNRLYRSISTLQSTYSEGE